MANERSSAVDGLQLDRARQRNADPLDEGLEDTFPASDPVSLVATGTASGAGLLMSSDAPRVDQALEAVLKHRDDPYVEPRAHLAALRDEAESLQHRAADDVRSRIRNNPWQAVGLAAVAGFIFGITR